MADQANIRFQRSRILQTENLSVARNFECKGTITYVKDRRRGFFLFLRNCQLTGIPADIRINHECSIRIFEFQCIRAIPFYGNHKQPVYFLFKTNVFCCKLIHRWKYLFLPVNQSQYMAPPTGFEPVSPG